MPSALLTELVPPDLFDIFFKGVVCEDSAMPTPLLSNLVIQDLADIFSLDFIGADSYMPAAFLSVIGNVATGRGVKDKQHGSASNTAKGTSVAFSTIDEHVNTPSVNLEKPLELNTGYYINDIVNFEGPTTSNSTPITSASILESDYFAAKLKGDMTQKSVNFCTLAASVGNGADAAISLESVRATSEWFANTSYGFFLGKREAYPVFANYTRNTWSKNELVKSMMNSSNRSSYVRVMIELRADEELKYTIMEAMLKLAGEGFSLCTRRVAYEWKPPRPISNKNEASSSCTKKHAEVSREKVSNSNPFDALNSVEDDDDLGMNERELKSSGKGSSHVVHGSFGNTPIIDKINKLERLILDGCYELLSISATVIPPSSAMLTTLSNNGGTNSERKAQSPHTGGGGGLVSEARVQSPKSGGTDYGQNYDAQSSLAALSLSKYT
ncbi:hypothetical protein Tco_1173235 [Tanacetum coccineum]